MTVDLNTCINNILEIFLVVFFYEKSSVSIKYITWSASFRTLEHASNLKCR